VEQTDYGKGAFGCINALVKVLLIKYIEELEVCLNGKIAKTYIKTFS
jgi:hypothetical protein